jgi:hypothetical protein
LDNIKKLLSELRKEKKMLEEVISILEYLETRKRNAPKFITELWTVIEGESQRTVKVKRSGAKKKKTPKKRN